MMLRLASNNVARLLFLVFFSEWWCLKTSEALVLAPLFAKISGNDVHKPVGRREALGCSSDAAAAAAILGAASLLTNTQPSNAAPPSVDSSSSSIQPMETINNLLARLKGVPTFCIVSPEGAAYMVFKNDQRMAVGYAFTTFQGALTVLGDAQRTAEQKGYFDVWKDATITTIPLDIAIRLALKKKERKSQKDQALGTLLNIIPGMDDRQDGIAIDSRFKDQGRVPLFYLNELLAEDGSLSVYFARKDLVTEWNRQNPGKPVPPVKAIDLVGIFENILRERADYLPTRDLVFVPTEDALMVAKEMKSRGLAPYNANRMII